MELNLNIADLFNALQEFKWIVKELHEKAGQDEHERKRLQATMAIAKKDIEELFDQVGVIGKGDKS